MQKYEPSLFARPDTMFGVCQALGEDFGVSPTWFRIGFASAVIFNIEMAIAAYVGVGLLVALVRLIHRSPRKLIAVAPVADIAAETADVATLEAAAPAAASVAVQADVEPQPELAVAA